METILDILKKIYTNLMLYSQHAELMNRNSGMPTFGIFALWTLNIAISTLY